MTQHDDHIATRAIHKLATYKGYADSYIAKLEAVDKDILNAVEASLSGKLVDPYESETLARELIHLIKANLNRPISPKEKPNG